MKEKALFNQFQISWKFVIFVIVKIIIYKFVSLEEIHFDIFLEIENLNRNSCDTKKQKLHATMSVLSFQPGNKHAISIQGTIVHLNSSSPSMRRLISLKNPYNREFRTFVEVLMNVSYIRRPKIISRLISSMFK